MRLLWISHLIPYPPKGGILQRSYHLLRQATRRCEVRVLALRQRTHQPTPEDVERAVEALAEIGARPEVFEIPADRSRAHWLWMTASSYLRAQPYETNWLSSAELRRALAGIAEGETYDAVQIETIGLAPYAELFPGTPIVLNHSNVESHMMRRRAAKEPSAWRRAYFQRDADKLLAAERALVPRCAQNLVVSELDAERLREAVGDAPIRVVANGVDLDYFRPDPERRPEPRTLVFAGGMGWYPNREALAFLFEEIWPRLLAEDPSWRIAIVGRNPPQPLPASGPDERVTVTGFVDDVRPYLDRASVYVCPIRTGGGTRLKILDALAMAKPVVATELAVEGLSLEDGAHFLRAESAEDFVRQIRRLDDDAELRRRLAEEGRRHVERRFSWDRIGEELEAAYREVREVRELRSSGRS